jgi:iron complex outermembrane receptor protein
MRLSSMLLSVSLLVPLASVAAAADDPARTASAEPESKAPRFTEEIRLDAPRLQRGEAVEAREVRERSAADLGGALAEQGLTSRIRRGPVASDVVLRGFQRDAVATTIDGAQVAGACPNRMDPPAFHIDATEVGRVEVTKGPFDVTLPGVLGGAVRVEPRRPHRGLNAEGNLSLHLNRQGEASAVLGFGHDAFDLLGSYALKYGEPYLAGDGRPLTAVYADSSVNRYRNSPPTPAYSMHTAWVEGGTSLRAGRDRLQLSYTFQKADEVLYPFLLMDAVYDDTHRANMSYRASDVGPFATLSAQAFFNRVDHLMNDERRCSSSGTPASCTGALPNAWSMETLARSQILGGRVRGQIGKEAPISTGLDVVAREWRATTTRFNRAAKQYAAESSIPDVTVTGAGAWAKHERPLANALDLSVGLRLDAVWSRAAQGDSVAALFANYAVDGRSPPLESFDLWPGGDVQLAWRPSQVISLWAGLGHSARAPDHQERYFALSGSPATATAPAKAGRIGRPDLRPMRNTELDVGVGVSTSRVAAKAQLFGAHVTDAILVAKATGNDGVPALTYRNTTARMAGGEAMLRVSLPASLFLNAALSSTFGWNTAGGPLQEMPPFGGLFSVRWDIDWVFVEAEEQFALPQTRVDVSVNEQRTAGWLTTSLKVGLLVRGVTVMAGVSNLFNRMYYEHLNYLRDPFASGVRVPEPGRTFFLAAQYAY